MITLGNPVRRRKFTQTEKSILKKVKSQHKREKRLDPTWFEAKRVDLGSEIVTTATKRMPVWGAFKFKYTKTGI